MTDVKHTPEPWHVRHCSGTIAVRGKRGVCVIHWHGPKGGEQHQRAIANASLIAAAPDLFSAASEAFDFLGGVDGAAEIRGKLLAALTRSTGDAS